MHDCSAAPRAWRLRRTPTPTRRRRTSKKAADFAKKGYAYGRDSGLIDRYGGRNAGAIHGMAQKGLDGYERLERAARDADGVIQAMR